MKFHYKLRRVCGAYYGHAVSNTMQETRWTGSNIVFDRSGDQLFAAVSNRIQVMDLKGLQVRTLPIEARSSIHRLALSPDSCILVVIDVKNYVMFVNVARGVVLHRMQLGESCRDIQFSPQADWMAVTHGQHVQVWYNHYRDNASKAIRQVTPLVLHRLYTGQADEVTCLSWSTDSSVLAAGNRDCTVRVWSVQTVKGYEPVTLSSHKRPIVGVYLVCSTQQRRVTGCYSISEDGTLVSWEVKYNFNKKKGKYAQKDSFQDDDEEADYHGIDEAVDFFTGGTGVPPAKRQKRSNTQIAASQAHALAQAGAWGMQSRHYFGQDRATVTATTYNTNSRILAVGFSSGLFALYEMPAVANLYTLSVGSNQLIKSCILNSTGEWLALACPTSQQLLVWEWRSETYVLKQRGHAYGMRCMAYSPDGVIVCTGGEDGKLKVWNATSGFCYVTMEQSHTAPISAVAFAKASVVLSASLDGTVKAHDLYRYRTFRTLTTPKPVQFLSLAVDPSGEIVTAGSTDPFHIYAWNLQTGKLLDVYTGHAGPVCSLAFPPSGGGILVSASWDGTVKLWDLYKTNVPTESLQHTSDVVCVAYRPDGKEICTGTIGGLLSFWDVETAKLKYEIDGRRDIAGGRKFNDRMTADNNASSRYFTSVCYSADGSCILAGGNSKFVCIYEISQQMLLKKFQVTFNRSLDGVLDELNSKNMGPHGPIDDHAEIDSEHDYNNGVPLPGARRGDDGSRNSKVEVLTLQVEFSSTGREWAAISGEGLHVYSLDDDMVFDPIALTEDITPDAVFRHANVGDYSVALRMSLHLNEADLIKSVLEQTPHASIPMVVRSAGVEHLERLMHFIASFASDSPHLEFYVKWCLEILKTHGMYLDRNRGKYMRAFRAMFKSLNTRHEETKKVFQENTYTLQFVKAHAELMNVVDS